MGVSKWRDFQLAMVLVAVASYTVISTEASKHTRRHDERRQSSAGSDLQIIIRNQCSFTIWPGYVNQGNNSASGFELDPNTNRTINVGNDWIGRIWGRTNCTFPNGPNKPGGCLTGECGQLECKQAGNPPATLAEFTFSGGADQCFYDLSLVDGYNLPMAIIYLTDGVDALKDVKASGSNPSCVASVTDFDPPGWNPYANGQQFLGTSQSDPLPFEQKNTAQNVLNWCPSDLQLTPPQAPGDGVYPYPDANVQRPVFNPCKSACAAHSTAKYCCTGKYDQPGPCPTNYYSKAAKAVCPDAYSYAKDDVKSTFVFPKGGEFEVIFCPGGRSTNILATKAGAATSSASVGTRPWTTGRSLIDSTVTIWLWLAFWIVVSEAGMRGI